MRVRVSSPLADLVTRSLLHLARSLACRSSVPRT